MAELIKPISVKDYLEFEEQETKRLQARWKAELDSFSALGDLYGLLAANIKVSAQNLILPCRLFLAVESQMYGVVSQLLRRRMTDALALTRRAIEAAAAAYLVWEKPALAEVFLNAYPNVNMADDLKQWKPSKKYKEEFSTQKLFDHDGEVWNRLRSTYQVTSAMCSHAGPGVLKDQENRNQQLYVHFVHPDEGEGRRHWYWIMGSYFEMLRVFMRIFREQLERTFLGQLEKDIIGWRDKSAKQFDELARQSSKDTLKDSSLILRHEQVKFLFR
ncbi:MAG: hypothetical protein OJF52_000763 [Nitrospira sp.]|jgi:hypothetical protein|nr:MAG: hypothetical protein OJF52_000763 [Nitrospira sp.]